MTIALQPPTLHLPSIKKLSSRSPDELLQFLHYLRLIYNPKVRGSKRRRSDLDPRPSDITSGWISDSFERAYAIRWLTAILVQSETYTFPVSSELLIQEAASLLATCSGTAGAGIIHRTFVFPPSIQVELTDVPLENQDFGSVGSQTWGGACVLAEAIVESPEDYGLRRDRISGLRVLELGAGTGLVSLVAGKILESWDTPFTLLATDFYPSVLTNLAANININFPSSSFVSSCFLDWASFPRDENIALSEPFDVILGADIIYEAQHAVWIKTCLRRLLRHPTSSSSGPAIFHLVIPLRANYAPESNTIDSVFKACPGDVGIIHKEAMLCDASEEDDGETVEYAYYKIAWI